ncbi:Methyltransferase [Phaffia rhodozyma]|uniref:Methyltransferase n=1 Tax=Phaffia rhodozyma TaxID=264483 RepID=A0A0F7SP03_PHARH|nr:Methyltransferase [Phaffia rhodozyma]
MSTFAQNTFNAAKYLSFRPTYPASFYDIVYSYHRHRGGSFGKAVDLGCGPGFIAQNLSTKFSTVIGIDPSQKMIDSALQPEKAEDARIEYHVGFAENLSSFVQNESVDLLIVGQACHWFDFDKVWPEFTRILKPKGTVAFFGYGEFHLPKHPSQGPLISNYSNSPSSLGPYWQQPGRSIVEGLLDAVPFPTPISPYAPTESSLRGWERDPAALVPPNGILDPEPASPKTLSSVEASTWDPSSFLRLKQFPTLVTKPIAGTPQADIAEGQVSIKKTLTWDQLEAYFRTWSSLHTFHQTHPEDKALERDIASRLIYRLRQGVRHDLGRAQSGDAVEVEWPSLLFLAGKK